MKTRMNKITFRHINIVVILCSFICFSIGIICLYSIGLLELKFIHAVLMVILAALFIFLSKLCIELSIQKPKQLYISDLVITDNELVLVYKLKNSVIDKKILKKDDIKSFSICIKIERYVIPSHRFAKCLTEIEIIAKNAICYSNIECFDVPSKLPPKYILQLIKNKDKIPNLNYNISLDNCSIKKVISFYEKKGRFPITTILGRIFWNLFISITIIIYFFVLFILTCCLIGK